MLLQTVLSDSQEVGCHWSTITFGLFLPFHYLCVTVLQGHRCCILSWEISQSVSFFSPPPPLYKNDNRFKPDLSQSTKTKNEDKVWRWVWTMQDHKWFSMFLFQEAHNEAQCFHLFYSSSGVTVMYWKTKMFPNIRPTINHMRGSSSSNFSIVFAIWARTVPLLMLTGGGGVTYDRRGPKQTNLVGYEDVSTL